MDNHQCHPLDPCFMPPHPELAARLLSEAEEAAEANGPQAVPAFDGIPYGRNARRLLGRNDGVIFPSSEFDSAPSNSDMRRAALNKQPLRGVVKAAIVLIDFPDKKMTNTKEHFENLFFSTGKIPTQSAAEYYKTVSNGHITLAGEVHGPYTMPESSKYYAHGRTGGSEVEPNTQTMAAHALAAVRGDINFDSFDNDHNGFVDALVIVHAGSGAEQTGNRDDIWSCKWVLPEEAKVNNVRVYAFLTIPDDARLGVCVHELGHLLFGWPDLYDITGKTAGVGSWCLMSGGSWNGVPGGTVPSHPSAWCKKTQGWVDVVNETENHAVTLKDVKDGHQVHRVWKKGGSEDGAEYFLVENRQRRGFDAGLPGSGLLIWHVDDAADDNTDPKRLKVGLMQADGRNLLATRDTSRGSAGNPFPGSSKNTHFTPKSNPNSRANNGDDTDVSITDISDSSDAMSFNVAVDPPELSPAVAGKSFSYGAVFRQSTGIGGYDLRSDSDLAFAFDYTASGKLDHLVLYRPGQGMCWILANEDDEFTPVYQEGNSSQVGVGIGGFSLTHSADRMLAFDYSSSGKLDHLLLYRPGAGAISILKNEGGTFLPVYSEGNNGFGIGGYDLKSPNDRVFAFDYRGNGKLDHLAIYRPGSGIFWILRNRSGKFGPIYNDHGSAEFGGGIGGFDLRSPDDRAFAYDWDGTGKADHIAIYRPGKGTFWCLERQGAEFSPVMDEGHDLGNGVGGYDLTDRSDVIFPFDFDGTGKETHLAAYRPQSGLFWVLRHGQGKGFVAVMHQGSPPDGVGGFDLKGKEDKVFAFDFNHSGKADHLVCYRSGTGTIWILKRK